MAEILFENTLGVGFNVAGEVNLQEQMSPALGTHEPFKIIQHDQALNVNFRWNVNFPAPLFGHWHYQVHFERIGGPAGNPPSILGVVANGVVGPVAAFAPPPLVIPAGALAPPDPATTTGQHIYRVVATITFHSPANTPCPIAGFADLGLVQVYSD